VQKGARVEWIYTLERDDPVGAQATAQLTAGSSVEEMVNAASNNGIHYLDIKEGGTAIELLGPYIHNRMFSSSLKDLKDWVEASPPFEESQQ